VIHGHAFALQLAFQQLDVDGLVIDDQDLGGLGMRWWAMKRGFAEGLATPFAGGFKGLGVLPDGP
jgi:hypothetical protein